jgi:MFS family permease
MHMSYDASLDVLNFLLADVRGGLGPYVSVYLLTEAHWDPATIGGVLTISGLTGIMLHAPVGALIDATRAKRGLLIAGIIALSACALSIAASPTVPVVLAADIVMAVLGAIFAPTVAAITLGLFERDALPGRLGRNAAFDRAGNLFIAAVAGAVGTTFSQRAVFYLVPFFGVFTILTILSIPSRAIDHQRARGLDPDLRERAASWQVLLTRRPFLVLAAAAALFHFASAPMLGLASQKLALAHPGHESALTSAAIVTAQLVMVPMGLVIARANVLGRKPLLITALVALPARGVLLALVDDPALVMVAQVLDGIGGGLFDALLPLVLADIMRHTGRYNLSRGVLGTVQGIGGSSSQVVAGSIVVQAGYSVAFLALTAVALFALVLVAVAMPETAPPGARGDARGR